MRRIHRCMHALLGGAAGSVVLMSVAVGIAAGQKPDRSKAGGATLLGRVIDTVGHPLVDADVVITRGRDTAATQTVKSNARGEVTIPDLPAGGPYTLLARKIGYGAAR